MRQPTIVLTTLLVLSSIFPVTAVLATERAESLEQLDCAALYQLASALETAAQEKQSIVFNGKSRLLATAIGTVTNVGFAFFAADIGWGYYEDYRNLGGGQQMDMVRQQMAQKYCFQKF